VVFGKELFSEYSIPARCIFSSSSLLVVGKSSLFLVYWLGVNGGYGMGSLVARNVPL